MAVLGPSLELSMIVSLLNKPMFSKTDLQYHSDAFNFVTKFIAYISLNSRLA